MKPPISVNVRTDNMHTCTFELVREDGVTRRVTVPSHGNVYGGLCAARQGIEEALTDLLTAPPAPPADEPAPDTDGEPPFDPEATKP